MSLLCSSRIKQAIQKIRIQKFILFQPSPNNKVNTTNLYHKNSIIYSSNLTKGISLFIQKKLKSKVVAGMTVEAALLIPLFIFFFLHLMGSVEIMRLHGKMVLALWDSGSQLAVYGYAYDKIEGEIHKDYVSTEMIEGENQKDYVSNEIMEDEDLEQESIQKEIGSLLFSHTYVKDKVVKYLGEDYLDSSPLVYGTNGLNFMHSSFMNDDCIDIIVTYQVKPKITIFPTSYLRMVNRCYVRAWTGYDFAQDSIETSTNYVYVTENGTVWHASQTCTYIKLSIRQELTSNLGFNTNKYGEKYEECNICNGLAKGIYVFVTDTGIKYHTIIDCSGIKRSIKQIEWTEHLPYTPCSRCSTLEMKCKN